MREAGSPSVEDLGHRGGRRYEGLTEQARVNPSVCARLSMNRTELRRSAAEASGPVAVPKNHRMSVLKGDVGHGRDVLVNLVALLSWKSHVETVAYVGVPDLPGLDYYREVFEPFHEVTPEGLQF